MRAIQLFEHIWLEEVEIEVEGLVEEDDWGSFRRPENDFTVY